MSSNGAGVISINAPANILNSLVITGGNTAGATTSITAGGISLYGGNNITLSQSLQSITISGPTAATTPSVISAAEMSGNTSGTSSIISSGTLYLQAVSPIGLSQSTTTGTGSTTSNILSIFGPTYLAGGGLGLTTTGGTISFSQTAVAIGTQTLSASGTSVTGTGISLALVAGPNISLQTATAAGDMTVSFSGLNAISAAGFASSTGTIIISAGSNITLSTGASSIQIVGPSTAAAVTLAVHQVAHGFSTGQAVYYTGSAWALAEANAVGTLGLGVIVVSDVDNFTVYFSGNISGLSGLTAGQYYFVSDATPGLLTSTEPSSTASYSNPLLFALSTTTGIVLPFRPSQNVTPIAVVSNFGVSSLTAGGVTQGTPAEVPGNIALVAGSNITLSQSSQSITIFGPSGGAANSFAWLIPPGFTIGASGVIQILQWIWPYQQPGFLSAGSANLWINFGTLQTSAAASTGSGSISISLAVFTRNGQSLSTATSGSNLYTWSYSSTGGTSTGALIGIKQLSVPLAVYMTPGDYWIGAAVSTLSGANLSCSLGILTCASQAIVNLSGIFSSPVVASYQMMPGFGVMAIGGGFISSLSISQLSGSGVLNRAFPAINMINSTF